MVTYTMKWALRVVWWLANLTSKPSQVSSCLIGCPIHIAVCKIWAKIFVNYYLNHEIVYKLFVADWSTSRNKTVSKSFVFDDCSCFSFEKIFRKVIQTCNYCFPQKLHPLIFLEMSIFLFVCGSIFLLPILFFCCFCFFYVPSERIPYSNSFLPSS